MTRNAWIAALCLAGAAVAASPARAVDIDHPWARPTAATAPTGAAYMVIRSATDDRLVAAVSPVAETTQLHVETTENGIMKMRQVDGIDLRAGRDTVLAPGGFHVMLLHLKAPLVEGTSFPLTLTFQKAGRMDVTVRVERPAAGHAAMPGMKM